jgi:uncharacterized protein YjbI with pentapeptide repeats
MITKRTNRVAWAMVVLFMCISLSGQTEARRRPFRAFPPLCGETLVRSVRSPDGRYTAAVFVRDCGVTTAFASHVNLRRSSRPFAVTEEGTVEDGCVFLRNHEARIDVAWKNATHLVIKCRLTEVFQRKTKWWDVTISYQAVSGIVIRHRGSNAVIRRIDADSLVDTTWPDANLEGALLRGMDLHGAEFPGASFRDADLRSANLRGADLSGAKGLISTDLTGAIYDARTRWPKGFDPQQHGAVMR